MSTVKLSIVTPEGVAFREEVESIVAPGVQGSFGVLKGHAPMTAALSKGLVKVRTNQTTLSFSMENGFLEVRPTEVVILASGVKAQ